MLFITIGPLILCLIFAELVFFDQVAGNEQFQGIVYRRAAYIDRFIDQVRV